MDKRKVIMFLIILLIAIILFLSLALLNINNENKLNTYTNNIGNNLTNNNATNITQEIPSNEVQQDDESVLEVTKDYYDVDINSVYFTIKDIADDFFKTINTLNTSSTSVEKLYNILAEEYINKNNITKQNLVSNFSKYINCSFKVERIKEKIIENNICIFIVYGSINENTDYNMLVITDETNLNYCIYPYEYLNQINLDNFKVSNIASKGYNKLEYKDINKEQLTLNLFADYKYYAQNNIEKLYNKLDSEYSKKRFDSIDSFKEYINSRISTIKNSSLKSYKITKKGNYKEYICVDNYDNYYIFKETSTMQYKILLDNYTIMTEEDIEYYNQLDKFDKSKYNLNKFINMVNTKDYNAIYSVLDATFKENNFKEVNTLKEYIQKNMYNINLVEIEESDSQTYEYYIFVCTINDMENKDQSKKMLVIINQEDSADFTMSFSFEEEKE